MCEKIVPWFEFLSFEFEKFYTRDYTAKSEINFVVFVLKFGRPSWSALYGANLSSLFIYI